MNDTNNNESSNSIEPLNQAVPVTTSSASTLSISVKKYSDDPDVDRFCVLANCGIAMIVEAGELLVKKQQEDPSFKFKIQKACPRMTDATLKTFTMLGLKEWHPVFILDDDRPGNRRMLKMPYSVQEQYAQSPVQVLVSGDNVLDFKISDLTADQANQVIGPTGIRTIAEQRAYIEARKIRVDETKQPKQSYSIRGDKVIFNAKTAFSSKELLAVMQQLK